MKIKKQTIINICFNENEQKKVDMKITNLYKQGFSENDFLDGKEIGDKYDWEIQLIKVNSIKE